jgi:hypothetical protein
MLEKGSDIAAGAYEGDYPLQLFSASVPAGDMAAKTSLHLLRNRTQVLLQLGSFIQCAVPALTIGGEVQTNDHLLIEFPLACGRQGVTFFIAGLLICWRFERVYNLGAYSIPSGDRPSHPIYSQQLSRFSFAFDRLSSQLNFANHGGPRRENAYRTT